MVRYVFCVWLGWLASSPLPAVHPDDEAGPAEPHNHAGPARALSQPPSLACAPKPAHPVIAASSPRAAFETDSFLQHIGTMIVSRPSGVGNTMISQTAEACLSVQQGCRKVTVSHTLTNITWEDIPGEPHTLKREGFFYAGDPPIIDNFLALPTDAIFNKLDAFLPSDEPENTSPKQYLLHLHLPGGHHILPPLTSQKLTHLVLYSPFYTTGHLAHLQAPNLKAIDYTHQGYTLFPEIRPYWRNVYIHAHHGFAFLPPLHRQHVNGEGNLWLPEENQRRNQQYVGLYQDKRPTGQPCVFVNNNEMMAFDYAGSSCGCADFRQDVSPPHIGFFTTLAPNPWGVNTRPLTLRFTRAKSASFFNVCKGLRPMGPIEVAHAPHAHSHPPAQPSTSFKDVSPAVWHALTSHNPLEEGGARLSITDHLMKETASTTPGKRGAHESTISDVSQNLIIRKLPDEMHVEIVSYLSTQDLVNLSATCQYYRGLCQRFHGLAYPLLVWDIFGQNLPSTFNLEAMRRLGLPYIAPTPFCHEPDLYQLVLPDRCGTPLLTVNVKATHKVSPHQNIDENQPAKKVDEVYMKLRYLAYDIDHALEAGPFYITQGTSLNEHRTPIMFALSDRMAQWWCQRLEAIGFKRITPAAPKTLGTLSGFSLGNSMFPQPPSQENSFCAMLETHANAPTGPVNGDPRAQAEIQQLVQALQQEEACDEDKEGTTT
ncbi:F-box protein [Candidatus Hepatobacter penaei]|uniref:F-box protein n=1 Tax=Candidatus Hepatobacter penaei TaxID=1274402 RepID=UPI0012E0B9B1|nr:F-box protein [Candidatus Hepatobacter penaei]